MGTDLYLRNLYLTHQEELLEVENGLTQVSMVYLEDRTKVGSVEK